MLHSKLGYMRVYVRCARSVELKEARKGHSKKEPKEDDICSFVRAVEKATTKILRVRCITSKADDLAHGFDRED